MPAATDVEAPPSLSARVSNGGFRPSQLLEFTPSDVMHGGFKRYPPSYVEPNYKYQMPSSVSIDKQFSFPSDQRESPGHQVPTTPVVSYLDPFTQQNYRYTPPTTHTPLYLREQPGQGQGQEDQVYTVQSSLLVGNHSPSSQQTRPGIVEDVYLKRPGYVFDESSAPSYRRPVTTSTVASPANKISYDSHDYPPPSYAAQQTSNFVPQPTRATPPPPPSRPAPSVHRPPYNRQDVNDNRPLAGSSIQEAAYASPAHSPAYSSSGSSNYANNFGNYLQRPPGYPSPNPAHYQYEPLGRPPPQQQQQQRPGHNYYEYQIGEIPPQRQQQPQQQFNYRPGPTTPSYRPPYQESSEGGGVGGLATLASLFSSTQQYAPQFTNLLLGGSPSSSSSASSSNYPSSSPLGSLLGAFAGAPQQSHPAQRPHSTQLIRALENIARNDDLQCVPKVLCQMIAGQTLRGQLPSFITSPAIAK